MMYPPSKTRGILAGASRQEPAMCYGVLEVPMKRPMLAGLVLSLAACGGGTGGGGAVPSTWSTYPLSNARHNLRAWIALFTPQKGRHCRISLPIGRTEVGSGAWGEPGTGKTSRTARRRVYGIMARLSERLGALVYSLDAQVE